MSVECSECNEEIVGDVVWYRPFGDMVMEDASTARFIAHASSKEMDNSLPFHPKCFTARTGQDWPPK